MTSPSDIAGLSERLRDSKAILTGDLIREAATALDSLSARVKELEAERDRALDMLGDVPGETLHDRLDRYVAGYMDLQATATRAEQQRDEAVTTTRYKIFDNLLGAYIGADNEPLRIAIGNIAFMIFPEYRDALRKTAEERRLASGPDGGSVKMEGK